MNLRNLLLLFYFLLPQFLYAQHARGILNQFPSIYNNSDSNINELKHMLSSGKIDTESKLTAYWAIYKLYYHQGNIGRSQIFLDSMTSHAKKIENNDFLKIALIEQTRMDEFLIDRKHLKSTLKSLESLSVDNALSISNVEFQFIKAIHLTKKSDSSLSVLQKAISMASQLNSKEQLLQAYLFKGQFLISKKSLYVEAMLCIDSVIKLAKIWNAKKYLALAYMTKGDALSHQGKFDSAISNHRDALSLFHQLKDVNGIILTYKYLGNCEYDIDKYADAIKYYQQGVALSLKSGFYKYLSVLYQNVGLAYTDLPNDSNIYYLEKGINTAKDMQDYHVQALASFNLAQCYLNNKQFSKAKYLMEQSVLLFKSIDEYNNVSWVLPQMVTLSMDQHNHYKTNPSQQEIKQLSKMLDQAVKLNADGNNYKNLQSIYKNYTQLALLSNDFKNASLYQSKLINLNDTIYNQERIKAALETSERLKTAEQESRIVRLELKSAQERSRQQLMWILFGFSAIGAIFFYWNYRKRMRQKNARLLRKQKEEFRNQLSSDLHDEVGTMLTGLAMQSEMVSLSSTGQQKESLEEISHISREAMTHLRDIVWTIDSRKDKFENLFTRMKIFTEQQLHLKNIDHKFTIEQEEKFEEILPEVRQNVYLIFKEIIANIIKHSNASFVTIRIFPSDNKTKLIVSDNGTKQESKNTDGIGKLNMEQRAKTIKGKLNIDTHNGYTVSLEF